MKTYIRITTALSSFVVLASVSPASAQYHNLRARILFEFTIGETTLPRDTYYVSPSSHESAFLVRGTRHGAFLLGYKAASEKREETPQLVFHRYEDQQSSCRFSLRTAVGCVCRKRNWNVRWRSS